MKAPSLAPVVLLTVCLLCPVATAQRSFNLNDYEQFLEQTQDLTAAAILTLHAPAHPYYKGMTADCDPGSFAFLELIKEAYDLTPAELRLLVQNHFVVSERLSFPSFGSALGNVYDLDLPVFVSTDLLLHALHASYDQILMDTECVVLEPRLAALLNAMLAAFPELVERYGTNPALHAALGDVDLYLTIAKSLLDETLHDPQWAQHGTHAEIWAAIDAETLTSLPLFSERTRKLDFSQFTVRGHYTREFWDPDRAVLRTLGAYFQCMMWLGRMEFWLTPPPVADEPPWEREEIRRMHLGAALLNELVDLAAVRPLLEEIDWIIEMLVGESDNLTPAELRAVSTDLGIARVDEVLDDATYDALLAALVSSPNFSQRILSCVLIMDPMNPEPAELPISFRLLGQRFILDSYVFASVVFPHVRMRMMPDPLDAMFVLGNDDALALLAEELEAYPYAPDLAALRYLVDTYDDRFWDQSLYNTWLQALRHLNPPADRDGFPFFMTTAAWQQQKLNTQLASWAELRHDNLLYAKQSYTGGATCSFPHSYVEPYPEFFCQITRFAENAETCFAQIPSQHWLLERIVTYFGVLKTVTAQLEILARRELAGEALTEADRQFLARMLFVDGGGCGAPPYSGWLIDLFYTGEDATEADYVIADVHTQPTDEHGSPVGRILHVGVGEVNLGIFLVEPIVSGDPPMAYVGPVMSYYEKVTEGYDRLTDERWAALVQVGELPARPDWVNIYLTDGEGNDLPPGRELVSVRHSGGYGGERPPAPVAPRRLSARPNPFYPATIVSYTLPAAGHVRLVVCDVSGRRVATLADGHQEAGNQAVPWDAAQLPSGIYFIRLQTAGHRAETEGILIR